MKKIIDIKWAYEINKDLKPPDRFDLCFIFSDNTSKVIEIYEPHGWFKFKAYYIVYGHENIKIFNDEGKELHNEYTR